MTAENMNLSYDCDSEIRVEDAVESINNKRISNSKYIEHSKIKF